MERIIDLHIHTTCSDGLLNPFEVVDEAKKNGVSVIAIADHDGTMAYTPELFEYADRNGVQLVVAVEMSTRHKGVGVHVLGYNFDPNNKLMQDILGKLRNARQDYLLNVSKKLEKLGYKVNVKELQALPSVTKAHISQDVVSNKNNQKLLMNNFKHIPTKGEFIETVMNEGCPAFVEKFSISPVDASEIIHLAGGKVVLAHPVAYKHEDDVDADWVLELAKEMKTDGIEANYLYVNRAEQRIDEIDFWKKLAFDNGYFVTVGSDFHSFDKVRPTIGFANTKFKLTDAEIQSILENIAK